MFLRHFVLAALLLFPAAAFAQTAPDLAVIVTTGQAEVKRAPDRAWVDIKAAISNNDNAAVLEECERGESAALIAYENALREEMPGDLRALLEKQYEGARRNHDRIRQLRDTARHHPDTI